MRAATQPRKALALKKVRLALGLARAEHDRLRMAKREAASGYVPTKPLAWVASKKGPPGPYAPKYVKRGMGAPGKSQRRRGKR